MARPTYDPTQSYPILDGTGATITGAAYDAAWTPPTPYDPSGDYPVLDSAGSTLVATTGAVANTPYDYSLDYPVLDGLGNTITATYHEDGIFDGGLILNGGFEDELTDWDAIAFGGGSTGITARDAEYLDGPVVAFDFTNDTTRGIEQTFAVEGGVPYDYSFTAYNATASGELRFQITGNVSGVLHDQNITSQDVAEEVSGSVTTGASDTTLNVRFRTVRNDFPMDTEIDNVFVQLTAPVAAGGILDQEYEQNNAITPLDVGADFTGGGMTYSASGLPPGMSISSSTGAISGTPTTPGVYAVTVTGVNVSRSASTGFTITINVEVITLDIDVYAGPGVSLTRDATERDTFDHVGLGVVADTDDVTIRYTGVFNTLPTPYLTDPLTLQYTSTTLPGITAGDGDNVEIVWLDVQNFVGSPASGAAYDTAVAVLTNAFDHWDANYTADPRFWLQVCIPEPGSDGTTAPASVGAWARADFDDFWDWCLSGRKDWYDLLVSAAQTARPTGTFEVIDPMSPAIRGVRGIEALNDAVWGPVVHRDLDPHGNRIWHLMLGVALYSIIKQDAGFSDIRFPAEAVTLPVGVDPLTQIPAVMNTNFAAYCTRVANIVGGVAVTPDAMQFTNWDAATSSTEGAVDIVIASFPETPTLTEYRLDGGAWTTLAGGTTTGTKVVVTPDPETEYDIEIRIHNAVGASPPSQIIAATSAAGAPTAPDAPTSLVATGGDEQVGLVWVAPADNGGSAITGYRIERSTGGAFSVIVSDTGNTNVTYTDTGLTNDTTYTYRVSAINAIGVSVPSNTDSATPAAAGGVPGDSGWVAAGTLTQGDDGLDDWNTPLAASDQTTDDFAVTDALLNTGGSEWLIFSNFGLTTTEVPADATITGIEFRNVNVNSGVGFGAPDPIRDAHIFDARLTVDAGTTPTAANTANTVRVVMGTGQAEIIHGGSADTWGDNLPSAAQVVTSGFGVMIKARPFPPNTFTNLEINASAVRVHYTTPS